MTDDRRGRADARERVRAARRAAVAAGTAPAVLRGPRRRASLDTVARMAAVVQKPHTPEARAKISAAMSGRVHTPEHVAARIASRARTMADKKGRSAYSAVIRKWLRSKDIAGRALVKRQQKLDLEAAALLGLSAMYTDVRMSLGWRRFRKVWDRTGRISDGAAITPSGKVRIMWGLIDVPNG